MIREARRQAILDASIQLFATKGYRQTKISEIARATGQSHGLVYHYFPSKDAIFEAIVADAMRQVADDLEAPVEGALAHLEHIVDRALARVQQTPQVGVLLSQILLLGDIPDSVQKSIRAHARRLHADWVRLIERGQREGTITDEASAAELAGMFLCAIRGLAIIAHAKSVDPSGDFAFVLPSRDVFLRFLRA